MSHEEKPEEQPAPRRARPALPVDYKAVYKKRKQSAKMYEHIKEYNRKWIAAHPEVNADNQRKTRKRRKLRKEAARKERFPGMVTVKEAVELLGVTRQRVHQLVLAGELGEVERDGKRTLIRKAAIDRYLELKTPA